MKPILPKPFLTKNGPYRPIRFFARGSEMVQMNHSWGNDRHAGVWSSVSVSSFLLNLFFKKQRLSFFHNAMYWSMDKNSSTEDQVIQGDCIRKK